MSGNRTLIGLLGPVAVGDGGANPGDLIPVPGVRARRLLVSLALADGRTRSAERLIDDVWGDEPPRSPLSALHTQISRLRPLLGAGRLDGVGNGYRLVDCRTDLDIVAGLAESADPEQFASAVGWWRGTPGDDLGGDGEVGLADELRRRAQQLRDLLDQRRASAALASGDYPLARELADTRCRADPLDESAHVLLMRALAGEGRTADALAVFARLRRALSGELGVDPGPQATALNAELVAAETPTADSAATSVVRVVPVDKRATRGRTVGLSTEPSDLIGRDDDVDTIASLFGRHRLITVQGPGGIGKTRVAQRVGNAIADTGRPVFYVPLAPVRNDDDVVAAIAAALGVGETDLGGGGRPRLAVGDLADRLVDAVRGQYALLILDNCEQVVDGSARVVADLLAAEPRLTVLTTSRAPLMLPAERIYLLPVLGSGVDGPAVELFERRARAIRADAALPRLEVAELCRHLDGLPLAIELAAARIRTMTVGEISARLAERFALLRGSDRSAPDRHRTLFAVIEWSWELLDDDARSALRRLCRFPAGFTTDAAGIVLGQSGFRLDDTLAALVNQSLLTVAESSGRSRYRMLEMVREFGEEMLTRADIDASGHGESGSGESGSSESDRVDRSMWRWARRFAEDAEARYDERVDEQLFEWVAADVENLVWVLRTCTVAAQDVDADRATEAIHTIVSVFPILGGFWMARGLHGEVISWGARLMAVLPRPPRDVDDVTRRHWQATILSSMAHLAMRLDLRGLAWGRYYLRLLHRPEHIYDEPTEFLSACALSRTPFAAIRVVTRAARSASAVPPVRIAALSIRMNTRENFGDLDRALADGVELQSIAHGQNNTWMSAMTQMTIGSIYGQQADWKTAAEFYRRGIDILYGLGSRDDELQTRSYLVATLVALGRLDEAAAELAIVADGWRPTDPDPQGNPEVVGGMMVSYAELEYARGEVDLAGRIFTRAAYLVKNEHPLGAQDPGMVMLLSAAVAGMVRTGRAASGEEFVTVLADGLHQTFGNVGWQDQPQAGSMAMVAGAIISLRQPDSTDGPWLLALSERLRARQDYPSLHHVFATMGDLAGLPAQQWDSLRAEAREMSRRQAVDDVRRILAPRRSAERLSDHALRM